MIPGSRTRWLRGKHANVDNIPFRMPVETRSSPAIFAGFSIDPDAAQALLPGQELQIVRAFSRAILIVATVNYQDTTIGRYVETCLGVVCTHGRGKPLPLAPLALPFLYGTGVYIYDLAVSTQISVKGGLGIWGMPKRQGNLDFVETPGSVSSQYDFEGQIVSRLDVPNRPPRLPFAFAGSAYGTFRGMLTKSRISGRGRVGLGLGATSTRLLLGDHHRAEPLKAMDIDPTALFSGYAPAFKGVLNDHIETWFLTSDNPMATSETGMKDVMELKLSQEWLAPPDRVGSDAMFAGWSPEQCVGRSARTPLTGGLE